jgi:hypothetical protein
MRATSLQDLKNELKELPQRDLLELCLKVAKYKKDNKEYLGYLLFESHDKTAFVKSVKEEIDEQFITVRTQSNLYFVKKSLRKILRIINKYSKYAADKAASAEMLIYFLIQLKQSGIPYKKSQQLTNMYQQQLKKINALVAALHEDLRGDFAADLERIAF